MSPFWKCPQLLLPDRYPIQLHLIVSIIFWCNAFSWRFPPGRCRILPPDPSAALPNFLQRRFLRQLPLIQRQGSFKDPSRTCQTPPVNPVRIFQGSRREQSRNKSLKIIIQAGKCCTKLCGRNVNLFHLIYIYIYNFIVVVDIFLFHSWCLRVVTSCHQPSLPSRPRRSDDDYVHKWHLLKLSSNNNNNNNNISVIFLHYCQLERPGTPLEARKGGGRKITRTAICEPKREPKLSSIKK